MKFLIVPLCAAGLITCSETVRLDDSARGLEFMSQEWFAGHGKRCRQVGEFQVKAIPAESSGEAKLSVLDVKAKNQGRRVDATHLLKWPAHEYGCDKDGAANEASERLCMEQEVTAYQCVIGRGT